MSLLRDTSKTVVRGLRSVVLAEGYIVTGASGAVAATDLPAGVTVGKTGTGEYTVTFPTIQGGTISAQLKGSAGVNARLHISDTSTTTAVIKTEVLSVAAVIVVDEGPPVTATTTPTVAWTATNVSGLMIMLTLIFRE